MVNKNIWTKEMESWMRPVVQLVHYLVSSTGWKAALKRKSQEMLQRTVILLSSCAEVHRQSRMWESRLQWPCSTSSHNELHFLLVSTKHLLCWAACSHKNKLNPAPQWEGLSIWCVKQFNPSNFSVYFSALNIFCLANWCRRQITNFLLWRD